jgi:hypothetical protein
MKFIKEVTNENYQEVLKQLDDFIKENDFSDENTLREFNELSDKVNTFEENNIEYI